MVFSFPQSLLFFGGLKISAKIIVLIIFGKRAKREKKIEQNNNRMFFKHTNINMYMTS
jgi:hypothetical protein